MLTAIALVHWPRFFISDNGLEFTLVNFSIVAAVGLSGPGAYSLDAFLGISLPGIVGLLGLLGVIAGWLLTIAGTSAARAPRASGA